MWLGRHEAFAGRCCSHHQQTGCLTIQYVTSIHLWKVREEKGDFREERGKDGTECDKHLFIASWKTHRKPAWPTAWNHAENILIYNQPPRHVGKKRCYVKHWVNPVFRDTTAVSHEQQLLNPLLTGPACRVFTQTGRCDRASKQRVNEAKCQQQLKKIKKKGKLIMYWH